MNSLRKYLSCSIRPALFGAFVAAPAVTGLAMCAAAILAPGAILANAGLFFSGAAVIGLGSVAVMAVSSLLDL